MSRLLLREHGIRYEIADQRIAAPVTERLGVSFANEPMTATLGASAGDFGALAATFIPECLSNNLSVVAMADDGSERVAGVLINRDFKSPMPASVPNDFEWFLPIYEALVIVDSAYEVKRPTAGMGETIDFWMLAVDADRFGRRGIGGTLLRLSTELAKAAGFARGVCECTGHFSQSAARKAGFSEMSSVAYKDFTYKGDKVFAAVPDPHTHLIFFEREL